jgi:ubiquinone/menaquinone biosynthesis C-methylase UbiE
MGANAVDEFVRRFLHHYGREHYRVLDVGCGPAPYREWVRGSYIGLDVTDQPYRPDMPRRVDVVGTAEALSFVDGSIDLIFSKSAFFLIPDPEKALEEFLRTLKKGGRILLLDYNRRTQQRLQASENILRPCWTAWELKAKVQRAGFRQCEILVPTARDTNRVEYWLRLLHQEFFGTWSIVTAVK